MFPSSRAQWTGFLAPTASYLVTMGILHLQPDLAEKLRPTVEPIMMSGYMWPAAFLGAMLLVAVMVLIHTLRRWLRRR